MLILSFAFCLASGASSEADSLLTLSDLIEQVRRENPELQAMRAESEAAGYGTSLLRHLPDPMVAFEFSENMKMFSVTQQVPFPTKLSSRTGRARLAFEQSNLLYEDREQALIRIVKDSYAAFLLLKGRMSATEKSIVFLEQIYNVSRQKYSINEASQAEVLISQVELSRLENQLMALEDDLSVTKAFLNTLLNRDLDEDLPRLVRPDYQVDTLPLAALYELARKNHPKLKEYDRRLRESQLALSIAKQAYLPDFTFRYSQELMENNMRNSKYMIGVTLPIWFPGKQRDMVREANSLASSARAYYEMIENAVLLDVKEARTRVDKYSRAVDLYRNSVLPQAETALKSAFAGYELNKVDFQILLEAEKSLVQAEYDYEEAQAMLFMAIAELEQAVGRSN
ncbi:MAG: TolC family protein [candidate division WOR-3 bacterium]|nr:MAG: TolC family protein [candidate division WOR-3 bacterium]